VYRMCMGRSSAKTKKGYGPFFARTPKKGPYPFLNPGRSKMKRNRSRLEEAFQS